MVTFEIFAGWRECPDQPLRTSVSYVILVVYLGLLFLLMKLLWKGSVLRKVITVVSCVILTALAVFIWGVASFLLTDYYPC